MRLIQTKSFTVQLIWSDAQYVSQRTEKDAISVKLLAKMYQHDDSVDFSEGDDLIKFEPSLKVDQ